MDLRELSASISTIRLEDSEERYACQNGLEKLILENDLIVKKLLVSGIPSTAHNPMHISTSEGKGVRTFDGKFTSWISFWEQFDVAIHRRITLSDVEKLAYLRNSLMDGSAKGIIDGLSTSGEFYDEAIETLKARYNLPRLIHQSHVRTILEAPSLKEGTGREIRRLHDTIQQHLRALKSMGCKPSGPFITSILELKLDSNTSFDA